MSDATTVAVQAPLPPPAKPRTSGRRIREARIVASGYNGARTDRPALKNWDTGIGSADADSLHDLPALRSRSRDLARNTPLAHGMLSTVESYAVGTGLSVQPTIDREYLGLSEEEADAWERQAERVFWAIADRLDVRRTLSFWGMQCIVLRSTLESGDLFTLRRYVPRPGDIIGLKLQLIEADRVCNPRHRFDTPELAAGVERDPWGAPIAYHVLNRHPGDPYFRGPDEWKRVPAFGASGERQTLHHFRMLRPDQSRGIPCFAPVVETLLQLGRYTEAEVTAAVVNAFFTVFVTSPGDEDTSTLQSLEASTALGAGVPEGSSASDDLVLGSGLVADLAPGEDITLADPNRPNVNFGEFAKSILQQVAVGLELPFEVLMKHFNSSYSAARAALLDAWKFFLRWRTWLAESFCQPVYEWALSECIARGFLEAPGFFTDPLARAAWLGANWVGDGPGQIDPLKEAKAVETRLGMGLTTLEEETAAHSGKDWQRNHEQRAKEVRMRKEAGLEKAPAAPADPLVTDEREESDG